jgi:DNA repair photolyase
MITELWKKPVTIEPNGFKHKSLSMWSCNVAVGCNHGCTFCYVPQVSTNRMASVLAKHGVKDPDEEWGGYVFPRPFEEGVFLKSLRAAEREKRLNADGNRAVMFCTTTDPYQVVSANIPKSGEANVLPTRRALEMILEYSTVNVRILTRSPLARQDFDLMRQFGKRLMFGMSLPTLDNALARIYEPKAPAPAKRLETLQLAKESGLHVFVAVAPVYPDCSTADMKETLAAVAALEPLTVFMEPINIRGENVKRIEKRARELNRGVRSEVFRSNETWRAYAWEQLHQFEALARQAGLGDDILHLWPDDSLQAKHPDDLTWLGRHWDKVSAWPGKPAGRPVTYWQPQTV